MSNSPFVTLLYLNKVASPFISAILHDFALARLTRGPTRVHDQLFFYFGNVGSVVGRRLSELEGGRGGGR